MSPRTIANQRRARHALFGAAFLFMFVQVVASLLLDYRWPEVRFGVLADLVDKVRGSHPDIVFLGSSRTGAGMDPFLVSRILDEELSPPKPPGVLNASIPAGDLITAEHVLRQLLHEGVVPRIAVVEVVPETVGRNNPWLGLHVRRQLRWDNMPAYFLDVCRSGQAMRLLSARLFPLYIHRKSIGESLLRDASDMYERFQGVHEVSAPDVLPGGRRDAVAAISPINWDQMLASKVGATIESQQAETQAGVRYASKWFRGYRTGGTACAALDRLLRLCRDHHIEVVLVCVPVASEHRELYSPEIEAAFRTRIDRLSQRYSCRFVDCRDQVADRYFVDNHHMTPLGRLYYSRKLTEEVLIPVWRDLINR